MADNGSHFFGRGTVHFTPPLRLDGTVDPAAPGAGANWADVVVPAGTIRMPPGRFVGNAKGLALRPNVSRANVPDYTGQGGDADTQIVNGVGATLTMYRHDSENLSDWLHATVATAAGGASSTIHAVGGAAISAGSLLPTDHLVNLTGAIVVTPSWEAAWTENVIWARDPAGIRMLQGFAGPVGGKVTITYSAEAGAVTHEALQRSHVQVGLVYAGVNRHDNRPVRADVYCAQIAVGGMLELINDATAELPLSMELHPVRVAGDTGNRWFRLKWGGGNG